MLDDSRLATDSRYRSNTAGTINRADLAAVVQSVLGQLTYAPASDRLTEAQTAYGAINSVSTAQAISSSRCRVIAVRWSPPATMCAPFQQASVTSSPLVGAT